MTSVRGLPILLALSCACAPVAPPPPPSPAASSIIDGVVTNERPEVGVALLQSGRCTATLIAPDVVLTAAHCHNYESGPVDPTRFFFAITNASNERTAERSFPITEVRSLGVYPGVFDLAVLKLGRAVPIDVATPAPLVARPPVQGETLTVFGFGCVSAESRARQVIDGNVAKRRATLTYTSPTTSRRLCYGDSGGPAFDASGAIVLVNSGLTSSSADATDVFAEVLRSRADINRVRETWAPIARLSVASAAHASHPHFVSPGSLASIYAARGLMRGAANTAEWSGVSADADRRLAEIEVFVGDDEQRAVLHYVSDRQINFVVPIGLVETSPSVRVRYRGELTAVGSTTSLRAAPGFFVVPPRNAESLPLVRATVHYPDGTWSVVTEEQPVATNRTDDAVVVLYGTGLRGTTPTGARVGGYMTTAEVFVSGDPERGLDQVNVVLPRVVMDGTIEILGPGYFGDRVRLPLGPSSAPTGA